MQIDYNNRVAVWAYIFVNWIAYLVKAVKFPSDEMAPSLLEPSKKRERETISLMLL